MRPPVTLTRRLIVMLWVWIFVWGMVSVDLFDLTDEFLQPHAALAQLVEPELDELDEDGGGSADATATLLFLCRPVGLSAGAAGVAATSPSTRPLYQQLAQYRI